MSQTTPQKSDVAALNETAQLPSLALDSLALDEARAKSIAEGLDMADRASLVSFGEQAQRRVADFADVILAQTRNKDVGKTGELLSDILAKAKGLDASAIGQGNFITRLFTSAQAQVARFTEKFEDVASQIDRVMIELDKHKETLRTDLVMLDNLHEQTRGAIGELDAYIAAGKSFAEGFKAGRLLELKRAADDAAGSSEGLLAAQTYQDALQALDRLEKRILYLQQARQIGIQQLPQIRIVQAGDETLIENLQATTELTIPVWKQKMILLLGLNRQNTALEMQKAVTDATNEMLKQASSMMKSQAISIEQQSQRGIVDLATLEKTHRDLIETISGVLTVQNEGRSKRLEIEKKLDAMTGELKKTLSALPGR